MGADQAAVRPTLSLEADVLYQAYRLARKGEGLNGDGKIPTSLGDTPNKGRAWYDFARRFPELVERTASEPVAMSLETPITPMVGAESGIPVIERLPTELHLRPLVAGDLRMIDDVRGDAGSRRTSALVAGVAGIDRDIVLERMALDDVDTAFAIMSELEGKNLDAEALAQFFKLGGQVLDDQGRSVLGDDLDGDAWDAVVLEALCTLAETSAKLITRSPHCPLLTIGPLRNSHVVAYEDTPGEWGGRIAALAKACGLPSETIAGLRIEDVDRAWTLFDRLKKKSRMAALSRASARASTRSTTGDPKTSPITPSNAS